MVRAPGCWRTRGAQKRRPAPWRSAPWGRKSAGTKGARNPITEMLSPSTVQQGTEVRQRPLGYSDIRMTLAICTHATDAMQDAATEALEEAFS